MLLLLRILLTLASLFLGGVPASSKSAFAPVPVGTKQIATHQAYLKKILQSGQPVIRFQKPDQIPVMEGDCTSLEGDDEDSGAAALNGLLPIAVFPFQTAVFSPLAGCRLYAARRAFPDARLRPATCQRHIFFCVFRV